MFFTGTFVCVCVRTCTYKACHCADWGNYPPGIRRPSRPGLDRCKVLVCFNPDDGGWSVSWAPIKSLERETLINPVAANILLWTVEYTVGIFPSFHLWHWLIFTRSQGKIGSWSGTHSLQKIIELLSISKLWIYNKAIILYSLIRLIWEVEEGLTNWVMRKKYFCCVYFFSNLFCCDILKPLKTIKLLYFEGSQAKKSWK